MCSSIWCESGAQCCLHMNKCEDCIKWCDDLLVVSFKRKTTHIKQMMQLLYYFLVIKYRSDILKHWTSGYIENIYMYNQIKVQCICETRISNSLLFWLGIGTVFSSFLPTAVFFSRLISGQLKLMFVNL